MPKKTEGKLSPEVDREVWQQGTMNSDIGTGHVEEKQIAPLLGLQK